MKTKALLIIALVSYSAYQVVINRNGWKNQKDRTIL